MSLESVVNPYNSGVKLEIESDFLKLRLVNFGAEQVTFNSRVPHKDLKGREVILPLKQILKFFQGKYKTNTKQLSREINQLCNLPYYCYTFKEMRWVNGKYTKIYLFNDNDYISIKELVKPRLKSRNIIQKGISKVGELVNATQMPPKVNPELAL